MATRRRGEPTTAAPAEWGADRWALVAVCVAVVIVYGSLLNAPPLDWDDQKHIFQNPYYQQGTWWSLWLQPYFGMYIPVMSTLWAALYYAGHGAAWPFRLLNVALHLANVVLFARLLRGLLHRFRSNDPLAVAVGAAVFALHPVQTAAVSWISGARDLGATMFALAAAGTYFGTGRRRRIAASTALFAAGLLCKPQIVAVPAALLVYVWWFERERLREGLAVMSGWLVLALGATLATRTAQSQVMHPNVPLFQRPLVALDALGFYVLKTIWPHPLAADYGRTPETVLAAPRVMLPTIVALAAAAALVGWLARRDRRFAIAALWVVLLAPVLGLVSFGYQHISTVADHYLYLPLTVVASVVALAFARAARRPVGAEWSVLALIVLLGGAASWRRAQDWRDNDRFFRDMLVKNPTSFTANLDLSAMMCDRGEAAQGLPLIREAASLKPSDGPYFANEVYCLFRAGRYDEAKGLQQRLLEPGLRADVERNPEAAANLASSFAGVYVVLGDPIRAFAYLCQAEAIAPNDRDVATNIASVRAALEARGRRVQCRGYLPWDVLVPVVERLE